MVDIVGIGAGVSYCKDRRKALGKEIKNGSNRSVFWSTPPCNRMLFSPERMEHDGRSSKR